MADDSPDALKPAIAAGRALIVCGAVAGLAKAETLKITLSDKRNPC
jgi:hypothetical protein